MKKALLLLTIILMCGCEVKEAAAQEEEINWTEETTTNGWNVVKTRTPDVIVPEVETIDCAAVFAEIKRLNNAIELNLSKVKTEHTKLLGYLSVASEEDAEIVREICAYSIAAFDLLLEPWIEVKTLYVNKYEELPVEGE